MANPFFLFVSEFIKSPTGVAAVAPSSPFLANAMLEGVSLEPGDVVVEYGPGTGAFTRRLAPLVEAGARYLGIERNPAFHTLLSERYPQEDMHFVRGSAEDVGAHLAELGLPAPKVVISGLPLAAMPRELQDEIVDESARVLAPGGTFRQFTYCHFYPVRSNRHLRDRMRERFTRYGVSSPVLLNVPPAFVYRGDAAPAGN